jgi:threonine dehydrogenase-like Zn-dependent dehydrogenase
VQAATLPAVGHVEVREVPDPSLAEDEDAIVRVTKSAICGSDLHVYHGHFGEFAPTYPIGHEYVGVVEAVGGRVGDLHAGMRVAGSFFAACGVCGFCRRGRFSLCRDVKVFGFGPRFGELPGTQAEYVRVPKAAVNLLPLPDEVSDVQGLFLGDALTTAAFGVRRAEVAPGMNVAVVGLGPVGLLAVMVALAAGAARVLAFDLVPERLRQAEALGAVPVLADAAAVKAARSLLGEQGVDAVVEAVGRRESLHLAFQLAGGFATVASLGVFVEPEIPLFLARGFAKGTTLRVGMANIQAEWQWVRDLVAVGRLHPERLVSHTLPLSAASEGYRLFAERQATKVVLEVG